MQREAIMKLFLPICTLIVLANGASATPHVDDTTLQLVQVLFRHGSRAPLHSYPNDPYSSGEMWSNGLGALTSEGMRQGYELGTFLRRRYAHFLAEKYNSNEIYTRSTDSDRTIMTAQCLLAGLYPPVGEQKFNKDLPWHPIPVHTENSNQDWLSPLSNCTVCLLQIKQILQSEGKLLEDIKKNYPEMYDTIEKNSGYSKIPTGRIFMLFDVLKTEDSLGYALPEWTHSIYPEPLTSVAIGLFEYACSSPEAKKLKGGPVINDMIENMNKEISTTTGKRLHLYSAHDLTLTAVMSAMGVANQIIPPYTAALILELHQVEETHWLQFVYRNVTGSDVVHPLHVKGCDDVLCSLENFKTAVQEVIPVDWQKECNVIPEHMLNEKMDSNSDILKAAVSSTSSSKSEL